MKGINEYKEPQHGDPVEILDQDTHEILFICPRCCTLLAHIYSPVIDGAICPDCWQIFDVIWPDETQEAAVTIHIDAKENAI